MDVNIIILNYNGEILLPECLPSVIEAKKASKNKVRITVIDNESTDSSMDVLKKYGPEIDIIRHANLVFCSFNDVIADQSEEVAILLNNDIRVDRNFIDPLVELFEKHDDLFLAAPKCMNFEGDRAEGARGKGFVKNGWFGVLATYEGWENEIDSPGYAFQSGFGAVRKDRFVELDGFDDLYLPGRLEDSDICFRAWKRGWKSYYQPGSVVYHKGGVSFRKKFGKRGIAAIDSRNSLLFFWKNISDTGYWIEHFVFIIPRICLWILRGDLNAVKGFFQAFGRVSRAISRRRRLAGGAGHALTDREVFDLFR